MLFSLDETRLLYVLANHSRLCAIVLQSTGNLISLTATISSHVSSHRYRYLHDSVWPYAYDFIDQNGLFESSSFLGIFTVLYTFLSLEPEFLELMSTYRRYRYSSRLIAYITDHGTTSARSTGTYQDIRLIISLTSSFHRSLFRPDVQLQYPSYVLVELGSSAYCTEKCALIAGYTAQPRTCTYRLIGWWLIFPDVRLG